MGRLREMDARGQAVDPFGLLLGPIGSSFPIIPRVPGANLIGKSAEYVAGYMDGYRHEAKPKNFLYSLVGFAVWGAAAVALAVGLTNAANSSANACGESCGSSCGDVFDNWATDACGSSSCSPHLSLR
jgi:hypothetical protein